MTPVERDAAVKQYERAIAFGKTKPLSGKTKQLWESSRRGGPKVGCRADRVLLSVEGGLLEKVDQFVERRGIPRSKLIVSLLDLVTRLAALPQEQQARIKHQILASGIKDRAFSAAVDSV